MNYKEILKNILENGTPKQPTRIVNGQAVDVENATIGTFCEIFRHDMSKGFPLTTLRKMPFKPTCVELEGFIKGITDKAWYQQLNCKYWNFWSNPKGVDEEYEYRTSLGWITDYSNPDTEKEAKKFLQKELTDLGPIYPHQWRNFGKHYGEVDFDEEDWRFNANGSYYGEDQLKSIVNKLKTSPYDRRMVCSAWNPNQLHLAALPSCHFTFVVSVYGNKLNLAWDQRSCDFLINQSITTYGLLLLLLCEESGFEPGELCGRFIDCHLYSNQLENAKILLEREERELPQVKIKRKEDGSFSIFDWTYDEVELIGYDPHPKLNMGAVTV